MGCYKRSLELALEEGMRTIAFPAISTGVYRFPPERAAWLAVRSVAEILARTEAIERVVFCCFSIASIKYHTRALRKFSA